MQLNLILFLQLYIIYRKIWVLSCQEEKKDKKNPNHKVWNMKRKNKKRMIDKKDRVKIR